ncbi:nitrous oxide reductase family maturation protein NosD [Frateuria soli]|uniref:nitrous oxide reductase family maturation protein NosD n=1 Tax=Frateuria soli TaxID=1542730 RepID=UPI001E40CE3A|nr:nitrous oxide reductase family maturation protein NosD [Frateuria soli]UGB37410.1 nitrous oxide reductase family maturation protein NosD [Frateuria soli]
MNLFRALSTALLAILLVAPAWAGDLLEQVVAAAPAGATVRVPAGVHAVHLKLERPITLVGEPGAILDGGGRGDVLRISAANVTVRDLIVRRSGTDLTAMNAGIYIERKARDVVIRANRVEASLFGIYLDGASNVRVERNVVRGLRNLRVADRGDGIHLWNDSGCTIEGNDVAGTRDGIYVYVSSGNTIARNLVHGVRYGVHYMYSQHNLLLDNVSRGNLAGYALMASHHLKVIGNSSEDEGSYGFLLNYISHSEVAGNRVYRINGQSDDAGGTIEGTEGKGLFVYLSQFNSFHDNLVADSQIGIHVTAGSESNRFRANRFEDNRLQVKYVQNLAQEWSERGRGNFWSDYLGWDLDADGIGDVPFRPNDGVDVLLWKYPSARNLMSSPSVLLMRYVQRAFPVFTPPSVQDSHPLMKAPRP